MREYNTVQKFQKELVYLKLNEDKKQLTKQQDKRVFDEIYKKYLMEQQTYEQFQLKKYQN